jgi:hypothetical protein
MSAAPQVVRQLDPGTQRVWFLFAERPSIAWIAKLRALGWKSAVQCKAWYHPKNATPPMGLVVIQGAETRMPTAHEADLASIPMTGNLPPPAIVSEPCKDPRRGDLVMLQRQGLLVGLVNVSRAWVSGYFVSGGNDGYHADKVPIARIGGLLKRATPALLAALEHRRKDRALAGDQRWRALIAAALTEPDLSVVENQEGPPT